MGEWPSNRALSERGRDLLPQISFIPYVDYARNAGDSPLSESEFAEKSEALLGMVAAILDGQLRADDPPWLQTCEVLQVLGRIWVDHRHPEEVERLPSVSAMMRVGTDLSPDLGGSLDRVIGPWLEELSVRVPAERVQLQMALAAGCFIWTEDYGSPFRRWCRSGVPLPPEADRRLFRAVASAPCSLWQLVRQEGGGWIVRDPIGLGPWWVPDGPVDIGRAVRVGQATPMEGGLLAGRLVKTTSGWTIALGWMFDGFPGDLLINSWLAIDIIWIRLVNRRVALEAYLRGFGHRLVRRAHEWSHYS